MLYIPEILRHTMMRGLQPRRTGKNIKHLSTGITRLWTSLKNGLSYESYGSLSPGFEHFWRRIAETTPNEESIETTSLYTRRSKWAPVFNSSSATVVNSKSLQPSARGTLHILKLRRNQSLESLVGSSNVEINHYALLSEGKMHKIQPHKTST